MTLIKNFKSRFKEHRTLFIILVVFGLIYCSISLVNHYNFRTSGDPLGIYTNAIYDYIHLRVNHCTLLAPVNTDVGMETPFFDNKLSDHFTPIQFFFAPFIWIFGTYTLLIIQIVFILFGGIGIYKFFKDRNKEIWIANLATIHYFTIWGIYSALSFDYHDNVIAAMLFPWLFYFFTKKKWWKAGIITFFMLICKENISLWLFFVFFSLMLFHLKERHKSIFAAAGMVISLVYLIVITKIVMPALANEGREHYLHFQFSALGSTYGEAIKFIISHPFETIKMLFVNHTHSQYGAGIKFELHYMVLISGGIALFFRPQFLIMLLPIFGQKLFHDDFQKWGINGHYSIEYVPILTLALFIWITSLKNTIWTKRLAYFFILLTFTATLVKNNNRTSKWHQKKNINFLDREHYKREFNVNESHKALKLIPDKIPISAHFQIVPHLSMRDYIYEFPTIEDSQYILLFDINRTWPISKEEYKDRIQKLRVSVDWEIIYDKNKMLIFKKKSTI